MFVRRHFQLALLVLAAGAAMLGIAVLLGLLLPDGTWAAGAPEGTEPSSFKSLAILGPWILGLLLVVSSLAIAGGGAMATTLRRRRDT